MRTSFWCAAGMFVIQASAADFQLTGPLIPEQTAGGVMLNISTSGAAPSPADRPLYENPANWQAMWQAKPGDAPTRMNVASAAVLRGQKLALRVEGALPAGDPRTAIWTVLFLPPREMAALPAVLKSTARRGGAAAGQPFLSSVGTGETPDVSISGTFLAGGNAKPIYTIQEQASLYSASRTMLGFAPGFSSALAVNQSASPPDNRTRLDPDSIQAALSFWRVDSMQESILYGMTTRVDLVNGEFARSDPAANLTAGFLSTFVLRRARLSDRAFFTLHPVLGLEAGHNLNAPRSLEGAPVSLSRYAGILRGVGGADAAFAVASADRTSNVFSIVGSYRVRVPATDEPLITAHHQQTAVDLTTRARHWIEVDIIYAPSAWKYLGLTAKYQYGSLPPVFSFVDHQATVGLIFQAKQTSKPVLPSQ